MPCQTSDRTNEIKEKKRKLDFFLALRLYLVQLSYTLSFISFAVSHTRSLSLFISPSNTDEIRIFLWQIAKIEVKISKFSSMFLSWLCVPIDPVESSEKWIVWTMSLMKFVVLLFLLLWMSQWTTLFVQSHASTEYVNFTVDTVDYRMK